MKTLFMETTKIAPEITVSQIQAILGRYGAKAIMTEYENREVSAVSFQIDVAGQLVPFRLPCRWEAVMDFLCKRRKYGTRSIKSSAKIEAQAKRVAWRQVLRWIEAQMALVETNMVKVQEVFMPYMFLKSGKTLYEKIEQTGFAQLENKREK
ncbi:MAG: hypothetical protein WC404_00110 [Candidatus Omnitrophota bacterium]|jgi:hypothetical protein